MEKAQTSGSSADKDRKTVTIERTAADAAGAGEIRGEITLDERVVATIAGLAARQVKGINALGRSRLIPFASGPRRGVEAEVGAKQAAFDLDVVIEYGCDIREVTADLRRRIASEVDKMAGREVVEINLNVVDVKLEPDKPKEEKPKTPPRVQ